MAVNAHIHSAVKSPAVPKGNVILRVPRGLRGTRREVRDWV